jgi:hypothetical protein
MDKELSQDAQAQALLPMPLLQPTPLNQAPLWPPTITTAIEETTYDISQHLVLSEIKVDYRKECMMLEYQANRASKLALQQKVDELALQLQQLQKKNHQLKEELIEKTNPSPNQNKEEQPIEEKEEFEAEKKCIEELLDSVDQMDN